MQKQFASHSMNHPRTALDVNFSRRRFPTSSPKRMVSFDDCANIKDDIDVTSRFLTSRYSYTTTRMRCESPRPKSNPCSASRGAKKPPIKRGMSKKHTLSRLSRSGCLRQLDEESSLSEKGVTRRHFSTSAVPSVSEDDMTLESLSDCATGANLSDVSSTAASDSSDCKENGVPQHFSWGHFVDFLPSALEQQGRARKSHHKKGAQSSFKSHAMTKTSFRYSPYPDVSPRLAVTTAKPSTNDISAAMHNISL
mmetsp:Transcript_2154/g.3264  ORF Transcript_2154/g.3264 Transcript_2154/m.3264 type:complete len:252 (-) Transcript_2154:1229-1984(-)